MSTANLFKSKKNLTNLSDKMQSKKILKKTLMTSSTKLVSFGMVEKEVSNFDDNKVKTTRNSSTKKTLPIIKVSNISKFAPSD